MIIKQYILAATLMGFSVTSVFAASCNLPRTEVAGQRGAEFGKEFDGYVRGLLSSQAHALYGQHLIDKYTTLLAGATRSQDVMIFSSHLGIAKIANEWANYMKIATVVRAIDDGEMSAISDMVIGDAKDKAFETFLSRMGITSNGNVAGALIAAIKITKESYDTLEHEACLTNIDISYYNFMNDPKLRWGEGKTLPPGAAESYFERYVYGAGPAPYGSERMQNRRNFQCYINEHMPEKERINVSSLGSKDRAAGGLLDFMNVGNIIANVMGSAVDKYDNDMQNNSRVRLPLTVMLRDFNRRMDIEEQLQELQRLRRSPEFAQFEAAVEAMRATEKIEQWLCDKLENQANAAAASADPSDSVTHKLKRRRKLIKN